jgi:hypothetical protein
VRYSTGSVKTGTRPGYRPSSEASSPVDTSRAAVALAFAVGPSTALLSRRGRRAVRPVLEDSVRQMGDPGCVYHLDEFETRGPRLKAF